MFISIPTPLIPLLLGSLALASVSLVASLAHGDQDDASEPRVIDMVEGRIDAPRYSIDFSRPDEKERFGAGQPVVIADDDALLLATHVSDTCVLGGAGEPELVLCSDFADAPLESGVELVPLSVVSPDGIGRWDLPSDAYAPPCAWLENHASNLVELIMRYEGVVVAGTCVALDWASTGVMNSTAS